MSYLALKDMQDFGGFEEEHLLYCDHRGGRYKAGPDGSLVKIGCSKCLGCDCKASHGTRGEGPDTAEQKTAA